VSAPVYDRIGVGYSDVRRADPRFGAAIWEALGDARTVLNIGAGAGSYEPNVRRASSTWHRLSPTVIETGLDRLRQDLDSGEWDRKHGHLRKQSTSDVGLRLVIARYDRDRPLSNQGGDPLHLDREAEINLACRYAPSDTPIFSG
jgi:hypothetical protein